MINITVSPRLRKQRRFVRAGYNLKLPRKSFGYFFRITMFFLLAFVCIAIESRANAQTASRTTDSPAIIALSGMNFSSSLLGQTYFPVYTENYIADALHRAMPQYRKCGNFRLCEIVDLSWGGNLQDTKSVDQYIRIVHETIMAIRRQEPNRTIVIVAHSWGSVVAYQALRSITEQQMLNNNVAMLISLGSPLNSQCSTWIRPRQSVLWPTLPGRTLIGRRLTKPPAVDEWINIWNINDPISGFIEAAGVRNERVYFPRLTPAEALLPKCSLFSAGVQTVLGGKIGKAHSSYYGFFLSRLRNLIYSKTSLNTPMGCVNLTTSERQLPIYWGVPYNVFDPQRKFLFEAICTERTRVQVLAGHNYPSQATYKDGAYWDGKRWVKFTFGGKRQGDWIIGRASATIPRSALASSRGALRDELYALTCVPHGGNWRCGCRTPACPRESWQYQAFEWRR